MGQCYCTGRCREGGSCSAYPQGNPPRDAGSIGRGTLIITPNTLTEEDVRKIAREEIKRSRRVGW